MVRSGMTHSGPRCRSRRSPSNPRSSFRRYPGCRLRASADEVWSGHVFSAKRFGRNTSKHHMPQGTAMPDWNRWPLIPNDFNHTNVTGRYASPMESGIGKMTILGTPCVTSCVPVMAWQVQINNSPSPSIYCSSSIPLWRKAPQAPPSPCAP